MQTIIALIVAIYGFQTLETINKTLFKHGFIETLSPVPGYVNNINFEVGENYLLLDFGKVYQKDHIEIAANIIVKRGDTTSYPSKLWNGLFAADYNTLYLKYSRKRFNFLIGRVPVRWSNSPFSSLIFTGYEPGLDLLYYSIAYPEIQGDYFFSILRDNEHFRYLAAHRIILRLIKNFQFSFGDIILYQTSDGLPDFYYFNPLAIYYVRQWTLDSSGMTNSAFDFKGDYIFKHLHLYGEVFIDDFPYIKVYHENPRMGGLLGFIYKKNNGRFALEYKRVNRFTYCYYAFAPYLSFKYFNKPLGTYEGNDFDKVTGLYWIKNKKSSVGIEIAYMRHGEGNIFEGYRSTSEESEYYFLSGVVERSFSVKFTLSLKIPNKGLLYLLPSIKYIKNYHHTKTHNVFLGNIAIIYSIG